MWPTKLSPILALFVLLLPEQFAVLKCAGQAAKEQTHFCEEGPRDTLIKPVYVPAGVLRAVMNSRVGKEASAAASAEGTDLRPEQLLHGTIIHPSNGSGQFFLLIGSGPLSGADNAWFWIVRKSGQNAEVLLWVGANCLNLKQTRTNGYRDVEADWGSASTHSLKHSNTMASLIG